MAKFLLLSFLFLVTGCNWGTQSSALSTSQKVFDRKDTLFIAAPEFPTQLDWQNAEVPSFIVSNLIEGLTRIDYDSRPMKALPALAESWEMQDEHRKYVFKVRAAKWSDGKDLQADQFVESLKRLASNKKAIASSGLYLVKNMKGFVNGEVKDFSQVGVKAKSTSEVEFTLEDSYVDFPMLLAQPATFPIRTDLIEKSKDEWSHPSQIATIGAYLVRKVEKEKYLLLSSNPKYFGAKPRITNIVIYFGQNPNNLRNSIKQGIIDLVVEPHDNLVKYFENKSELVFLPDWSVIYLAFNFKTKPLDNPIFRRIIATSINRGELIADLGQGRQATSSLIMPDFFGYESNRGVRYDPKLAAELMRKYFSSASKYYPLEIRHDGSEELVKVADAIRMSLEKNLGVESRTVEAPVNQALGKKSAPTLHVIRENVNLPLPETLLGKMFAEPHYVSLGWRNFNFGEFSKRAAQNENADQRQKYYSKAQHILTEGDIALVPLFLGTKPFLIGTRLKGFLPHTLLVNELKTLSLN